MILPSRNGNSMSSYGAALKNHSGVEFVAPLVADMMHRNPSKRPTITEVVDRFARLRSGLGYWKLRSRLVDKRDDEAKNVMKRFCHFFWTIVQIVLCRPSVPRR